MEKNDTKRRRDMVHKGSEMVPIKLDNYGTIYQTEFSWAFLHRMPPTGFPGVEYGGKVRRCGLHISWTPISASSLRFYEGNYLFSWAIARGAWHHECKMINEGAIFSDRMINVK